MTIDRAKLEEVIRWSRGELANFTDRPIHNVEAATKTKLLIDAAEAHLATLPKTKMVEVWRVEAAIDDGGVNAKFALYASAHSSREDAENRACVLRMEKSFSCIRVTGPHQQEVPA